ncbi:MAG: hypothetical protein IJ350_03000, partial [Clostridia bacterium]|nr:hypothetical protein [Clostridia bacterium]
LLAGLHHVAQANFLNLCHVYISLPWNTHHYTLFRRNTQEKCLANFILSDYNSTIVNEGGASHA